MRIWHQSYAQLSSLPNYRRSIEEHGRRVLRPGSSLCAHGLPAGDVPGGARHSYLARLKDIQVCDAAIAAEEAGFDAFVVGCIYDPGMAAARSVVDIPVLGMAETAFHYACTRGSRFGLISPTAADAEIASDLAASYGLGSRVAASLSLDPALTEPQIDALSGTAAATYLSAFVAACGECKRLGADVVIPAEGVLAEFLVARRPAAPPPLPVIDAFGVLWMQAEVFVEMRAALDPVVRSPSAQRSDPDVRQVRRAVAATWSRS